VLAPIREQEQSHRGQHQRDDASFTRANAALGHGTRPRPVHQADRCRRSSTWLIADAPLATSAVPRHVIASDAEVNRSRRRHVVAAGRCGDHERVQADLREDDEIVEPGVRA
jgi:hypothetical protein